MKQKNKIKLVLDVVLLCVLVLLYNKRSLGMTFHEIGGLALLGGLAIHLLLNAKWIGAVTKKLACRGTAAALRIGWLVDALLLCCFAAIGISGALISHIVFSFGGGMGWKTVHYFASAMSLVLMGVHLGLHTAFFSGMVRGLRMPVRAVKPVAVALSLLIFGFGCYSIATTSFLQWLAMPFSATTMQPGREGNGTRPLLPEGTEPGKALPEGDEAQNTQQEEPPELPDGVTAIDESANGFGGHRMGQAKGEGGGNGAQTGSPTNALTALVQFFSIMFVFAVLTAGIRRLTRKKPQEPAAEPTPL